MHYLIKNFKFLFLAALISSASCSFTTKNFDNPDRDKMLIDLITYVIDKAHFEKRAIDDEFSEAVFDAFINQLDPLKNYFYSSDIKEFSKYKHQIDNQIQNQNIDFFNVVYERFIERREQSAEFYKELLAQPFDFKVDEEINTDYDNIEYAANKQELKERWRKYLKFSVLSSLYNLSKENDTRVENEADYQKKSFAELEKEARESMISTFEDFYVFQQDLNRNDYFSIYLNSVVEQFDPHTNYMAPYDKDRFDVAMSGKLEGIGARLQKQRESVKVVEVIIGGPAWRGEELEVGDLILKVKQENEDEFISIGSMRLDDAVNLIKGPKGTSVTLNVKKVDGTFKDITIKRDVVEIEETYAKSSVIKKGDKSYGIIDLPRFYFDMEDRRARNAATDIKEEIIKLKNENIEGLIIDLRNNGGGSLKTAIDIAGLFIERGPVVQVLDGAGKVETLEDRDRTVLWDGALVLLVNEFSASASEILAAAMQDYKRGVVIGSQQTYGKGTVQNLLDLNQWLHNNPHGDLGGLKITTQKFYRINGGSTQLEGVKSDIVIPDRFSYLEMGERDYKNPMAYDKINPAKFSPVNTYSNLDEVLANSRKRVAENQQVQLVEKQARWIKNQNDLYLVPLNFDKYVAEIKLNEEVTKEFDALSEYQNNLVFVSHLQDTKLKKLDSVLAEKKERWHKNLAQDIYVEEAVYVLEELKLATNSAIKRPEELVNKG